MELRAPSIDCAVSTSLLLCRLSHARVTMSLSGLWPLSCNLPPCLTDAVNGVDQRTDVQGFHVAVISKLVSCPILYAGNLCAQQTEDVAMIVCIFVDCRSSTYLCL